ncbi:hypothetical protein PVAND_010609 [Polypedilum vanderplanki]|uniref:Ig-like domain-containing protein n=1 Tax=Polypedilum vanderplanki TaxID=319348 RepID=A0A9J6CGS8_POLVA|nr:hypothetical protein PVAND_010609 [Polypedilum vanderplanki]
MKFLIALTMVFSIKYESTSSSNVEDSHINFVSKTSSAVSPSTSINNKNNALYHKNLEHNDSSMEHAKEEFLQNSLDSRPYFDDSVSQNVTVLVGSTAYLKCRVHNLGNKTVSFIRHRDLHLLTVGKATYTPDYRFQSVHNSHTDEWSLKVLHTKKNDSGVYECQVGSSPPVSITMMLFVVEPVTIIMGMPEMFIEYGSTINLTCIVKQSPDPPTNIIWTHNGEEVSYDSSRGGVSVITEKSDITTSYLLIQRARSKDSGTYTCNPSNAKTANITVHILNGENPAAIQCGCKIEIKFYFLIIIFITLLTLTSVWR